MSSHGHVLMTLSGRGSQHNPPRPPLVSQFVGAGGVDRWSLDPHGWSGGGVEGGAERSDLSCECRQVQHSIHRHRAPQPPNREPAIRRHKYGTAAHVQYTTYTRSVQACTRWVQSSMSTHGARSTTLPRRLGANRPPTSPLAPWRAWVTARVWV